MSAGTQRPSDEKKARKKVRTAIPARPIITGAGAVGLTAGSAIGVDAVIGLAVEPSTRLAIVLGRIVAGLVALTVPRLESPAIAGTA
jgi:hypothetical protein